MRTRTVFISAAAIFAAVFFLVSVLIARQGVTSVSPTRDQPSGISAAVNSYTVRGRVTSLPSADGKRSLEVHHEAIDGFVGKSGQVTGMKEMVMPFPDLAATASLDGIKDGDLIEFHFEVRWDKPPRTLVTSISRLAPETVLKLSPVVEQGK